MRLSNAIPEGLLAADLLGDFFALFVSGYVDVRLLSNVIIIKRVKTFGKNHAEKFFPSANAR